MRTVLLPLIARPMLLLVSYIKLFFQSGFEIVYARVWKTMNEARYARIEREGVRDRDNFVYPHSSTIQIADYAPDFYVPSNWTTSDSWERSTDRTIGPR